MANDDVRWFWATHEDEERWSGGCDTREEAIAEAETEADSDASIWVGKGHLATPERLAALIGQSFFDYNIWENLTEIAADEGLIGEDGEVMCDKPAEALAELQALARRHFRCAPTYYAIGEEKERIR